MELKDIVALYRRWIWLLIVGLGMGLVSGYVANKIQAPLYEASAKVLVVRNRQQGGADLISLSDQQLVSTYLQLLKTRPVLAEAGSRLGTTLDADRITTQIVLDTQIIQIKVRDNNPARAVAIANTLVQVLIEQNETLQAGRYARYEESLTSQIAEVQTQINALQNQISQINQANIEEQLAQVNQQIADLKSEISTLEADRANLTQNQAQIAQLQSLLYLYQQIQTNLTFIGKPSSSGSGIDNPRITTLQSTLSLYQQLYLSLLNNLEAAKLARVQSTPTVTLIETATLPKRPIKPSPLFYMVLSGMVGLFLTAGLVLLLEYFDDTLRTTQMVQEIFRCPVIGQITEEDVNPEAAKSVLRADAERSRQLNAFASLRVNLSRLMASNQQKTILVTSAARGEGKTTVAVKLAEAFRQSGRKVTLIDADLYHPRVHKRLDVQNECGLTDILSGGVDWGVAAIAQGSLNIITSGAVPASLYGLLESDEMKTLLDQVQKQADIVVVDGPPLFVVDAQILASRVGSVLLVIQQRGTKASIARSIMDQLDLIGVNPIGVVFNRVSRSDVYYYDGYYDNSRDAKPKEETKYKGEAKPKQNWSQKQRKSQEP